MTEAQAIGFPGQGGDWKAALRTLEAHPDDGLVGRLADALGTADWASLDQLDTRHSQPVVFVAGLVACRSAGVDADALTAVVGHSLGEITACCFAGAIEPHAGLDLVRTRAELGHAADADRPGAMVAVMRLPWAEVDWGRRAALATGPGVLEPAVANSDTQFVLSGDADVVDRIVPALEAAGGVTRRLPIGGAYHSPLLAGAVDRFAEAVARAVRSDPVVPVVASTTATPMRRAEDLAPTLSRSLVLAVDWPGTVDTLAGLGVRTALDAGPGEALVRLSRFAPAVPFHPLTT